MAFSHGAELIGGMYYDDTYKLAFIRGPEGIVVALAEQLGWDGTMQLSGSSLSPLYRAFVGRVARSAYAGSLATTG